MHKFNRSKIQEDQSGLYYIFQRNQYSYYILSLEMFTMKRITISAIFSED